MKLGMIVFLILLCAIFVGLLLLAHQSRLGHAPGLLEGRLAPCPKRPNCLCSEYENDSKHFLTSILLKKLQMDEIERHLGTVIEEMGGRIITREGDYMAVEFHSSLFRFVDDVEFRLDRKSEILHMRAASRVGHSDFGANKKRVDRIRALLDRRMNQ